MVLVNGVPLPPNIYGDILEISVDTDVFMPSMFTILINDSPTIPGQPLLTMTDNALLFRIGAAVKISVTTASPPSYTPNTGIIFEGEITAIEPLFREDGQVHLRIRGFDKSHRLTLGKNTRVWGTDIGPTVTETQIVSTIAGDAGLSPMVNMIGIAAVMHNYILQYNQSDWDFLWARARLFGYQVYCDGSTLHFAPASVPRHLSPVTLEWGNDLQTFKPRFVASNATTGAEVHSWSADMKNKVKGQSIPGSANVDPTSSPAVSKLVTGSTAIKTGMSSGAKDHLVDPIASNQATATVMASALFLEHESHYVRASGTAEGNPDLMAGCIATVSNIGIRFAGAYFVTKATHIYRHGEYTIDFEVSGRNPFTFSHLTGQDPKINQMNGAVVGIVSDNTDPMMLGRVKVSFPWMPEGSSGEIPSSWARVAALGGGKNGGLYFTPEVGDEVLVVFEMGDVNMPYIVGALWNSKDKPPKGPSGVAVAAGKVNQRIIKSRTGHVILLDDTAGKESIVIQDKSGNGITLDAVKNSMTIKTKGDLILDVGGKFTVTSKMDFSIESKTQGAIKTNTKLDIEAKTGAVVKASTAELNLTPASTALKGTQVDIQGTAKTSVKGSAMVEIQGGLVKIN